MISQLWLPDKLYPISRGTPITLRSGSLKHDSKWWFTTKKGLSAKTEKKKNCSKELTGRIN